MVVGGLVLRGLWPKLVPQANSSNIFVTQKKEISMQTVEQLENMGIDKECL